MQQNNIPSSLLQNCVFLNGNGQFCYFDSHSRNKKGEQCRDGTAILMSFPTLHQFQLQLFRLVKSLGHSQCFRRYELQPLQVHRKDNTDVVARTPIPTSHVVNEESQIHDTQESHNLDSKISNHVNDLVSTKVYENQWRAEGGGRGGHGPRAQALEGAPTQLVGKLKVTGGK